MAVYGFRIHTLRPHVARGRTDEAFLQIEDVSAAGGPADAFEHVKADLLGLKEAKTQVGTPTFYVDDDHEEIRLGEQDGKENLPYFEVIDFSHADRVIEVSVETGKEADHDALVSRDGTHQEIKKKAAVRRATVLLIFPRSGDLALMVSEVRGRNYAGERLLQWLTRRAQRAAVSSEADGKRSEEPWLNWKMEPQIDGDRLDGILQASSDHSLKLRRRTKSSAGGRGSYDLELVQFGLKQTKPEQVLEMLAKWADRLGSGTELDRRKQAAEDVATLVGQPVGDVDFDDGEISFKENGKTQTVTSESIDKLFVYPIGAKRPKPYELRVKAAPAVQRIAPALGIAANLTVG
jgi:hypothetical protein